MINVVKYEQTCWACPSQWEGTTDAGWYVYARYRGGHFSVDHAPNQEVWGKSWRGKSWDQWNIIDIPDHGDNLDGFMSDETLRQLTEGVITWP